MVKQTKKENLVETLEKYDHAVTRNEYIKKAIIRNISEILELSLNIRNLGNSSITDVSDTIHKMNKEYNDNSKIINNLSATVNLIRNNNV